MLQRQAFIRETAARDASALLSGQPISLIPSPTFGGFPKDDKESRLGKVRMHTKKLSARFCNSPVYVDDIVNGNIVMLRGEHEMSAHEEMARGKWADRESTTLEESGQEGSEKDEKDEKSARL
jgi:hypothetical protein